MPQIIAQNSPPSVDPSGNVTIVTTTSRVYTPKEFMVYAEQLQKTIDQNKSNAVQLDADFSPIKAALIAVAAATNQKT